MSKRNPNILTLYVEKDFSDELKARAKKERLSLSAWFRVAALEKIRREEREQLDKPC